MVRAIAFDFDGVLVESVDIKTKAFESLFAAEGPDIVREIVRYHLRNGGVSRFEKFKIIYHDILRRPLSGAKFDSLCEQFAALVVEETVAAPWVAGATEFLLRERNKFRFFVVSGTPEGELREIIKRRSGFNLFDDILGSPRIKELLLLDVITRNALDKSELVFVGDAETDWLAAQRVGVRFVWRKRPEHQTELTGFNGPSISSLVSLERCISDYGAR